MSRKKDALTILEEAKAAAIPKIVENLRKSAAELIAEPAMSGRVSPEERKHQYRQRIAESSYAISHGLPPDGPGTLGELIRSEQQRWELGADEVPLTILDYITSMKEKQPQPELKRQVT